MKAIQTTDELIDTLSKIAQTLGITQSNLAMLTGIDQPNISRFFSKKNPELKTLIRVAGCMGVTIILKTEQNEY